jgi:2-polyprenyl-3-methyl-5-hydroxy-6-metoxy-1,4-benzoquinol methylase
MINYLHSRLHRPENGWDPVPPQHAEHYGAYEWQQGVKEPLLDELDRWIGGLAGKKVLDLGGGPGQYSIAFAKRGCDVTWHDVSCVYRNMAQEKAREHGVRVHFSLGYMDEAQQFLSQPFDLVFNRCCWNYGFSERSFANVVFALVKPGGVGYIDTCLSSYQREQLSALALFRTCLNDKFAIKIGHPFPPHGRLARFFVRKPLEKLLVDYSSPFNDRLIFIKSKDFENAR